jgi:hypothetical protein
VVLVYILVVMEEILTLLQLMEQALVVVLEVLMEVTEKMLEEAEVPSVVEAAVLLMPITLNEHQAAQVVAVLL